MSYLVPLLAQKLAQKVELYPAHVEALRDGLEAYLNGLLLGGGRLSAEQACIVRPLAKVQKRMLTLATTARPGKARKVRLEFDELVALRRQNGDIQAAGGHEPQLIDALGQVHQKAVSLDPYINADCP